MGLYDRYMRQRAEQGLEDHGRAVDKAIEDALRRHRQELAEVEADRDHWKANHDEMVARNRMLRDRPDLPADRVRAHRELVKLQEKVRLQQDIIDVVHDMTRRVDDPVQEEAAA